MASNTINGGRAQWGCLIIVAVILALAIGAIL